MKRFWLSIGGLHVAVAVLAQVPGPWPISNSYEENADVITSAFGPRNNGGRYQIHYGIDLNRPGGGEGDPIYASFLSVILDCGTRESGIGHYIELSFADSFDPPNDPDDGEQPGVLKYWHLQGNPCDGLGLRPGDEVNIGAVIGYVGGSGAATSAPIFIWDIIPIGIMQG